MKTKKNQAFTLVELIIVITILAILGTIAFISLQGYSSTARNSRRISDVNNIKTSLELFALNTGVFPLPDNGETVSYSGELARTQGIVGDNVTKNLSKNLNSKPTDPLLETAYTYSITSSKKEYQVLSFFEGELSLTSLQPSPTGDGVKLLNHANAANYIPKLEGNYNEVFVKTASYIIPTPSIINAEIQTGGITLNSTNIKSQIITSGDNFPNITGISQTKTGAIEINFNPTLNITKDSTTAEKITAITAIQSAYNGTILASEDLYKSILNTTNKENLANTLILKLSSNTNTLKGWREIDSNCDIDDIVIGNQTWAGCNSTLGNGFEFGQLDSDIGTNNYNGTVGDCYPNYDGVNNNSTCIKGDIKMASNTKANIFFTGTTINGDTEVANIWGKLYTWDNSISACQNGRHVPSNSEFETLETSLNGGINCRNATDGYLCDGLGWKFHSTTNSGTSMASILKLPLAGSREGSTFRLRGFYTYLWSSTPNTNTYYRSIFWSYIKVTRGNTNQIIGFSVRCIKD